MKALLLLWATVFWAAVLMLAAGGAESRTWYVKPDGSGEVLTIQAGIDSAATADTVLLADGVFAGAGNRDLDFMGKEIVVRSESGDPDLCIIDCGGTASANHFGVHFMNDETGASVLEGVTIRNGYANYGAAIYCYNSSPRILSCILEADTATASGGAVSFTLGAPALEGCTLRNNHAASYGGAVDASSSSFTATGSHFSGNAAGFAGGGVSAFAGSPVITGCTFRGNYSLWGGGMAFYDGTNATVDHCISQGNQSQFGGGGIYCFECSPLITGCTLVADSVGFGGAIHLGPGLTPTIEATVIAFCVNGCAVGSDLPLSVPAVTCCEVWGNEMGDWTDCIAGMETGGGNMHSNPLFCDIPTGDISVEDCSPCLSGNNDCGIDIGAAGAGCLCGAATEPTTWGAIKAMYR